jgi:tRNA (guanine-N7-)-methyltransferase
MRLRNVKNKEEILNSSQYLIKNPEEYIGKWRELFNNDNPIYIEIGMGKGKFIIENAIKYPNINFIGIEKFDSVIVRAIEKIEEEKLDNLKLIRMDALDIENVFDKEVDVLYLNFSDPWPKNRHEDRRLSSKKFLDRYEGIFKNTKTIVMKTDNRKLFEFSLISFVNQGYKLEEISLDLYDDDYKDNIPTEYETKFKNRGQNIYMVKAVKL